MRFLGIRKIVRQSRDCAVNSEIAMSCTILRLRKTLAQSRDCVCRICELHERFVF